MAFSDNRPNWLSEIIEARRIVSDRPIPLEQRKAERDAIVAAIKEHPEGEQLAVLEELPDMVWAALGAAYNWERQLQRSAELAPTSPAIHASLLIFSAERWKSQ
jgi:hypothetical protein